MTMEATNKGAAVAAIASPWWLPGLHTISEVAALVLPIMGVLWIVLQVVIAIYKFKRGK
jgi:Na+/alanine symporter